MNIYTEMNKPYVQKILKSTICAFLILSSFGCTAGTEQAVSLNTVSENDGLWEYSELNQMDVFQNDLLGSKNYTVSFWIKPSSNKTGTVVFSLEDDNGNYLKLLSSGYSDGVYSGLTLTNDQDEWIVADGINTLKTGRYNYVAVTVSSKNAVIYLNGTAVAEGKIHTDLNNPVLRIGYDSSTVNSEIGYYSECTVAGSALDAETIQSNYQQKYPAILLDTIEFEQSEDQIDNLWLVDTAIDGVAVTYTVSNTDVMDYRGIITKPDKDTAVDLTATIDTGISSASKTFTVNVLADSDETFIKRDAKSLDADVEGVLYSRETLPETEPYGSAVSYKIINGNADVIDHTIIKTDEAEEKERITIEATLSLNNEQIIKTYDAVLLDEVGGYIMSYFNGDVTDEEEKGKLAYSTDGLHWTALNNAEPVITSDLGNGRIRDPFIGRDADGSFVILATEGFNNPYIYVIKSPDLIDLSEQSLIQVSYYDAGLEMSGTRAWAPEMLYDNEKDLYYIYFSDIGFDSGSDENTGHIFYVTTKDFIDYSYPRSLFSPGYTVIDGTILTQEGYYWLFYKDERKGSQTIFYASTTDLSKGFDVAYDGEFLLTEKYMEGPFVVSSKDNTVNYLYIDNYNNADFHVASFSTLGEDNDIQWLSEDEFSLPEDDMRHGASIPVTEKELQAIINAYQ